MTLSELPTPFLQIPRDQRPSTYSAIIARTRGDATALLRDMRRELLALDPNLVFVENQTMEMQVDATLFPMRASAWLVSGVGLVAMLLAAIGLYGVIAYSVARRTREIGIRIALGARPGAVVGLVMRQGLLVAVAGLLAGVRGHRRRRGPRRADDLRRPLPRQRRRSVLVGRRRPSSCSPCRRSPTSSPPGAPRASIRRKRCASNRPSRATDRSGDPKDPPYDSAEHREPVSRLRTRMISDIRVGLRLLWRDKAFTITAALTLALCIGANTALFSVVHNVLLRPLPVPESDRIVLMGNAYPGAGAGGRRIVGRAGLLRSAARDGRLRGAGALQRRATRASTRTARRCASA